MTDVLIDFETPSVGQDPTAEVSEEANMTELLIDIENTTIGQDTSSTTSAVVTPESSSSNSKTSESRGGPEVDLTLLRGLEPAMEYEEQAHLTSLLTSGNPDDLAAAAELFYNLQVCLKEGAYSPAKRNDYQRLKLKESFLASRDHAKNRRAGFNDRDQSVMEEKKVNDVDRMERSRALPLPVRMPRYEALTPFNPNDTKKSPLSFVSDPWDGTLGAAFTKLQVHRDSNKGIKKLIPIKGRNNECHVDHEIKFSPGFDTIVDRMPGGYSSRLIPGPDGDCENRVLISSVQGEAAKLGLQRGDVVTHVNGKPFTGTVRELNDLIWTHYQEAAKSDDENNTGEQKKLEIVVNGELCVAQALKLRAMGV